MKNISTVRKFGVGIASLAMVASMAAPAFAADTNNTLPGFHINSVARLAGLDRIDTSFEVARHEFSTDGKGGLGHMAKVAYIVNYRSFVDAATAGMLTDGPIIFVDNNRRTSTIVGKFLANSNETNGGVAGFQGIRKVIAVGGESVVTKDTLATVAAAAGVPTTERIGGKDRYETSVQIAQRIYDQASDNAYTSHTSVVSDDGRLGRVYFANGADSHVVDSMVAGVLDNGPILLVDGSGKLPKVVVDFLKKTLPMSYGVLGGPTAVPDSTVAAARQVAVYGNNWDNAPMVPTYQAAIAQLQGLIDGRGHMESRVEKSTNFMGYKKTAAMGRNISIQWSSRYETAMASATSHLSAAIQANSSLGVAGAYSAISSDLQSLYGDFANSQTKVANYFKTDGQGHVTDFDFAGFEAVELKQNVADAEDALNTLWGKGDQAFANLNNAVAKASQIDPSVSPAVANANTSLTGTGTAVASGTPLASVKMVAAWVADVQAKQLSDTQAKLKDAQAKLAAGLNEIDYTAEVRLGGKDRFATAAAVAQEWAKDGFYSSSSYGTKTGWPDVYVANAWALPDAIVAGQLSGGPILLAANGKDMNKVTAAVAAALPLWQRPTSDKTLYGVGGPKVLDEDQLKGIAGAIDNTVATAKKAVTSPLSIAQNATQKVTVGTSPAAVKFAYNNVIPSSTTSDATVTAVGNAPTSITPSVAADGTINFSNTAQAADAGKTFTYQVTYKGETATFTITIVSAYTLTSDDEVAYAPGTTAPSQAKYKADNNVDTTSNGSVTITTFPGNTGPANQPTLKVVNGVVTVEQKAIGVQAIGKYDITYMDKTATITIKVPDDTVDSRQRSALTAGAGWTTGFDLSNSTADEYAEGMILDGTNGLKKESIEVTNNSSLSHLKANAAPVTGDFVALKKKADGTWVYSKVAS